MQIATETWCGSTNPIVGELEVDVDPLTKERYSSYSFSALHFESTVKIEGEIRTSGMDPHVDYREKEVFPLESPDGTEQLIQNVLRRTYRGVDKNISTLVLSTRKNP